MFVSSICITDNFFNKEYDNAIMFLIVLAIVLVYAYRKIKLCKNAKTKKCNCIYMYIGIVFFLVGICITYKANKSLIENKYDNNNFNLQGVIGAISQKADSYAITITDIANLNVSTNVIDIYNKDTDKMKKILVYIDKDKLDIADIYVGKCVLIQGTLCGFVKSTNPGQFNEYDYYVKQQGYSYKSYIDSIENIEKNIDNNIGIFYKTKKMYYKIKNVLYNIRCLLAKQYKKIYNKDDAALIIGMILGDKVYIDEDIKELYQKMGISHILAISGLHISLLGMVVYKILTSIKIHTYVANILTIIFLILYGVMTDFSVSTNRAVVMMSILLIGKILGRTYDMYTAISLSLIIILIQNPLRIYNTGMQFSYASVLGVVVIFPILKNIFSYKQDILRDKKGLYIEKYSGTYIDYNYVHDIRDGIRKIIDGSIDKILAGFSIYLMNLPIMINSYYEISLYSIIINILVLCFIEILIYVSIISLVFSFVYIRLGEIIGATVTVILSIYEKLGYFISKCNFNILIVGKRNMIVVMIYYMVIIIAVCMITKNKKYIYVLLVCSLIVFKVKDNNVNITMIDVSQGDGICIETINNKVITIDCGSSDIDRIDRYRIVPFLKSKGISTIDYAMVSHVDEDHISGIKGILVSSDCGVNIKNLVLPYIIDKSDAYKEIENVAKKQNIKVLYVKQGNRIEIDNVNFTCMHPSNNYVSNNENGYSMVLLMSYKKFDMLFTGDIGVDEEKVIVSNINNYNMLRKGIEVIKVPHHGSKNSSHLEFIEIINPKYALISAGRNNMYGHPHKDTVKRYSMNKTRIYTTIDNGAISIKTDGKSFAYKNYM